MGVLRPTTTAASVESIEQAVRRIREVGGLACTTDGDLEPLLVMIVPPGFDVDDDDRARARDVVLTFVRRTCQPLQHDPSAEACDRAAARALWEAITRRVTDRRKLSEIRRTVGKDAGCQLSLDGIRKREDKLLAQVAAEIHRELMAVVESRGPQTVEALVHEIADEVKDAFESLDDGLKRIYAAAPTNDERERRGIRLILLHDVAVMQCHWGRVIELRLKSGQHSPVDLYFADLAAVVMSTAFGYYDDRQVIQQVLALAGLYDPSGFLQAIHQHEKGADILRRWDEWISGCHGECAYQRTYQSRLLCGPHQLAFALYTLVDTYDGLLSGELGESLATEVGVR